MADTTVAPPASSDKGGGGGVVPEGLKPVDIPVPIFPQRTASVPTFSAQRSVSSSSSAQRPLQALFHTKADWRLFLTVEERQLIRRKISSAYENRTRSYEELLQTCAAIEEELVFVSAPSRLDYFKTGMQFEKRVADKLKHLTEGPLGGRGGALPEGGGVFSPSKPAAAMQSIAEGNSGSGSSNESTAVSASKKRQREDELMSEQKEKREIKVESK